AKEPEPQASQEAQERLARRQALAAVTLLRCGHAEHLWPLLQQTPDPGRRTYLIHLLSPLGADPRPLWQRLEEDRDDSVRRALVLSLGQFPEPKLPAGDRRPLADKLL